jgi:TIR domain
MKKTTIGQCCNLEVCMNRTKVFVSYSHRDSTWLERLKVHLALLQRRGVVHVWSDTRIEVGVQWRDEIEAALTESRAAVLLITPDFLASEFVWNEEMPRILAHQKEGMLLLPLIARPCAWRIAPELAALQARPLSLETEADADQDLAEFVYEIAGRLEQLSSTVASEEVDEVRTRGRRSSDTPATASGVGAPSSHAAEAFRSIEVGREWVGVYHPTERRFRLVIRERKGHGFSGTMHYLDDGSVTEAEGLCLQVQEASSRGPIRELIARIDSIDFAVTFRETRILTGGKYRPELAGEYLAVVAGRRMSGVWQSGGKAVGSFDLRVET